MRLLELKVPPPVIALLLAVAMWGIARQYAPLAVSTGLRWAITGVLFVFGMVVGLLGGAAFRRAKTTSNPLKPEAASALVTGGVYRYTRNPMYIGGAALLLSWASFLAVPWGFLGPVAFIAFMSRFQIIPEERALRDKFVHDYIDYQQRVGRWF